MCHLANGIKFNSKLEELYLSKNRINKTGAVAVGQAHGRHRSLKKLDMTSCMNEGPDSLDLARSFKSMIMLEELVLADNWIGESKAWAVALAEALA